MKPIRARGEVRRLELTKKIQNPDYAQKVEDVPEALEKWDTHMREYLESGGRMPSFDERRSALLSILPDSIRKDVFMSMHIMEPGPDAPQHIQDDVYMQMRSRIQKHIELIMQYSNIQRKANVNHVGQQDGEFGGAEDFMPEPASDDAAGQALLAVYQKGYRYAKGKGKGKTGSAKGSPGKTTPVGGRCLNCGKEGHRTSECRRLTVPASERPCFNCGEKGHIAANCPKPKKPQGQSVCQRCGRGADPPSADGGSCSVAKGC